MRAMRNISDAKPVRPIDSITPRISACSGFDLIRMRYGRWMYRRTIAQPTPSR